MVKEIEAKSIISSNQHPSSWFGVNYSMNLYRGCQFGCIYCDSRSNCYRIENFDDIEVKINGPELLEKALSKKYKKSTIGTGAMSDAYIPLEKKYGLMRKSLEIIEKYRFRVHIATKSNLILRDIDLLEKIARRYASVAFTVTTMDEKLSKIIEPGAPTPSERMQAMGILSEVGVRTGILMMPQLPFIMENEEGVREIVQTAKEYRAEFIVPAFGMTLRSGQREYYYEHLDKHKVFQGLSDKYKKRFKERYQAGCINYSKLKQEFIARCKENNISYEMPSFEKYNSVTQLSFFE